MNQQSLVNTEYSSSEKAQMNTDYGEKELWKDELWAFSKREVDSSEGGELCAIK